ncbi:hypothetical protein Cyrtocomes_01152 [Candidatus Cyrtobacter comes]|uniref:Type IV conjugative transfer system protein TraL n=1 Tax=Candidatus Cyrtobacter comes TaxID=675776 RepID=A0ABU5L9G6_9RICK|nr:type IV conjugative transfer system protein TraL [Candidatus Cyrtobacter comes]MDZ5762758.1 hypothetical protein [Candidatus Cyrtobacter comes]
METKLFNYLDEERKILGFTMLEICCVLSIIMLGLVSDMMLLALISTFGSVVIVRFIKDFLKKTGFKRRLYFFLSDFVSIKNKRYFGKYYV